MSSRTEELLTALINGQSVNITPKSRVEQILLCCINKHGVEHCVPPKSNIETLLQELAVDIEEGSNKPVDVATASAMNALLVSGNVGKVYRYTGTTDTNYTNGDIYIVEQDN